MSPTLYVHSIYNVLTRTSLGITDTCLNSLLHPLFPSQGDIFSGLNDGILSRAEALAAVDMQKHPSGHAHSQMSTQLKHDVMYHHGMGAPPQRPLQVSFFCCLNDKNQRITEGEWFKLSVRSGVDNWTVNSSWESEILLVSSNEEKNILLARNNR